MHTYTHKRDKAGRASERLFTTMCVVGWIQSIAQNKSMSDSQLAWHHLARDKPACPWHDNETHTHIHTQRRKHTQIQTHTISPSLLRYKEKCSQREARQLKRVVFIRSRWKEAVPGYKTETQQDPLFILDTRVGIRNTEELEWDSAGGCGGSWTNIWEKAFYLKCSASECEWVQKADLNLGVKAWLVPVSWRTSSNIINPWKCCLWSLSTIWQIFVSHDSLKKSVN